MSGSLSRKLLGMTVALSFLTSACGSGEEKSVAPQAIPVKLQTLETATVIDSSEYVGILEARGRVSLSPQINGRILRIFVQQGDTVKQGQPIAELEPTQQQEQVNAATAQVNVEKARLGQTQAEYQAAEAEKARTAAELERVRADVEDAKAQLALAKVNHERSAFLVKQGVNPKQDLDDKVRDLESSKAQLNAREKALQAARESLHAAEKRVEQALANIDAQKAAVAQAEGQLGAISQELDRNTIVAPIDGIVASFDQKKVGDIINSGEQLTTITDDRVFEVNINIPTEYRSRLRVGLPVEIIKEDGSEGVKGKVTYIAPLVEQNTQSILAKVTFDSDGSLRDREYVRVQVNWDEKPGVLIPTTAVSTLGGQKFVFVAAREESKNGEQLLVAKQKPIQVGNIQGQAYQVFSGVKAGDRVAVSRILDLQDGTPIAEESLTSEKTIKP
ncbi:efflux RND transporter periplasmic adaptor subunit [Pleurocapsales cyanobacterium LEGE 06147]|nr:efflux RND transporter periplasmic adaptor subunit [Pleurocapsales cyanobacterium LEGE 06147]